LHQSSASPRLLRPSVSCLCRVYTAGASEKEQKQKEAVERERETVGRMTRRRGLSAYHMAILRRHGGVAVIPVGLRQVEQVVREYGLDLVAGRPADWQAAALVVEALGRQEIQKRPASSSSSRSNRGETMMKKKSQAGRRSHAAGRPTCDCIPCLPRGCPSD
jgi:hypothetical protein